MGQDGYIVPFLARELRRANRCKSFLLDVKKVGPDLAFTPRNSKNTKFIRTFRYGCSIEHIILQLLKESAVNVDSN